MNIFEAKITAQNVRAIWEANENVAPFLGEVFFPNTKQVGLDLNLIKGKSGAPVALVSANWDTNVLFRDRIGFNELHAELPYFKEAYQVSEKLRQKIITSSEQYRAPLFSEVFNDINDLLLGADVTAERMRMQLLGTGTISIQENGVDKQYDYGFDNAKQFKTEAKLWNAEGATPLKSLADQIENAENVTKSRPQYAVMGKAVAKSLFYSPEVDKYFASVTPVVNYATPSQRKAYVEATLEIKIFVSDKKYVKARDFKNRTEISYYPEDRYTLISTLDLGETVYGTTPEEIDLLGGGNDQVLSCEVLSNGVAITTWRIVDPVNVNTKVSEVVVPSCPNIDKIYIVKVL